MHYLSYIQLINSPLRTNYIITTFPPYMSVSVHHCLLIQSIWLCRNIRTLYERPTWMRRIMCQYWGRIWRRSWVTPRRCTWPEVGPRPKVVDLQPSPWNAILFRCRKTTRPSTNSYCPLTGRSSCRPPANPSPTMSLPSRIEWWYGQHRRKNPSLSSEHRRSIIWTPWSNGRNHFHRRSWRTVKTQFWTQYNIYRNIVLFRWPRFRRNVNNTIRGVTEKR